MMHALPVNCCVLNHFALILLCGNPIGSWLLCDVPKLKLEDKYDEKMKGWKNQWQGQFVIYLKAFY